MRWFLLIMIPLLTQWSIHARLKQAIELSDPNYCSVAASLRPTAEISMTFEIARNGL